ncbi:hypothetical protein V500_02063 [Pseudogymnoascus sp. VKM F-4518 (FW-2643)]|nr:hypothetical protein V500_02063 [Pseudogymnoascus sp. VKM F-4518 (FW-2643)]
MAGPGGGPRRRSHTKSRKGCDTCKRRHIRCDENFPQCKNCTKHNVHCPYIDTPEEPDLLWTPKIEAEIDHWQKTGIFPFPELSIYPQPNPQAFSAEDLRLMHHVAGISTELGMIDAGSLTIWANQIPLFLKIGSTYGFVMHALLAFSATHIAWLTECPIVMQMAYGRRGIALKGLHEETGTFSWNNSDAVLAASLLLSWQATEWRGWIQLMHGTSSVIDAMQPWKNESQFGDFIAEQSTFPTAPPSPIPNKKLSQPLKQDLDALGEVRSQLQIVKKFLVECGEDTQAIAQLASFVRGIRKITPTHTAAQRFEMLNPLRTWLFWLPAMYLQQPHVSPNALVVLSYYYTVALVIEPIFPEVGAAYFGSLSLGPIEEIARRLFSVSVSQTSEDDLQTPLALMEYPIDMVTRFRRRMGWEQPERTASFPTFQNNMFHGSPYDIHDSLEPNHFSLGSYPAFSYSQEHLISYIKSEPGSAISALSLDPSADSYGQYLGIPSPIGLGGYDSPGRSSYGDVAYSDQGDDFLYDIQGRGPGNNVAQDVQFKFRSDKRLPSLLTTHDYSYSSVISYGQLFPIDSKSAAILATPITTLLQSPQHHNTTTPLHRYSPYTNQRSPPPPKGKSR